MEYFNLLFYVIIFLVAFIYSSVGHGGASGYLALMAIFEFAPETMKATALTMNLFVAGIAFYINTKAGNLKSKILIPLVIFSIPMAYFGAKIHIDILVYQFLLGTFLIIVSILFVFFKAQNFENIKNVKWFILLVIGGILGFVSGVLGIGGGVILSPILLLFHWAKLKEASAIASAFIFVNSLSGLIGLFSTGYIAAPNLWLLVSIGVIAAFLGSYSAVNKLSTKTIKYILSIVLFTAGIKLVFI